VDLRFELEQLVIEGHASEPGQPVPRGLQLQLTDPKQRVVGDTSVMANVGYFQFKSSPGLFQLDIRSGRGQDVYDLNSIEAKTPGLSYKEDMDIALTSFNGLTIMPIFKRKGGMEGVDVLQEMPVVSGFMDRIYSS
jgi:UDP-glucose:glycoprotein glucosyltransferase